MQAGAFGVTFGRFVFADKDPAANCSNKGYYLMEKPLKKQWKYIIISESNLSKRDICMKALVFQGPNKIELKMYYT